MHIYKWLILVSVFHVAACSDPEDVVSDLSKAISDELQESNGNSVDFSLLGGEAWSQVCFFGPYNEKSSEALGFGWNVGDYTDVLHSDGHNVIVFATSSEVVAYVVHSRSGGDFSQLSGDCLPRDRAKLVKDAETGSWLTSVPSRV